MPTGFTSRVAGGSGAQSRHKTAQAAKKKKPVASPISMDYMPGSVTSVVGSQQFQKDAAAAQNFVNRFQKPAATNAPTPGTAGRFSGGSSSGGSLGYNPVSPSYGAVAAASGGSSPVGGYGSTSGGRMNGAATGLDQELTGWAKGLKPDMLNTLMLDNREAFLRQIMDKMGLDPDTNIGALMAASPYIRGMNELALVMLGADPNFETGDMNSAFNWMGDFASQGMTPGGDMIDFSQGLANLMGAATGGDSLNALESYLNINDPQGQVDAMMSLAVPLANASLHPYWADAFSREMSRQGDAWTSKSSGNNMTGAFNSFFRDRMGY